jgi:hypothetical protein
VADLDLFGTQPVGLVPTGSIYTVDHSIADPLDALLRHDGEVAYMMCARVWDFDDGQEVDVYASTHGFATAGDGASLGDGIPDHTLFPQGLIPPNSSLTLFQGGRLANSALPAFGVLSFANGDGEFDEFRRRYGWRRRRIDIWATPVSWTGPGWAELALIQVLYGEEVTWDATAVEVSIRDPKERFKEDINPERFLGFGTAIRLQASGDGVRITGSPDFQLSASALSLGIMFQVEAPQNAVLVNYGWTPAAPAGWELRLGADDSLMFINLDHAPLVLTASDVVPAGAPHRATVEADSTGIRLYVDGQLEASSTVPFAHPPIVDTTPLVLGTREALLTP